MKTIKHFIVGFIVLFVLITINTNKSIAQGCINTENWTSPAAAPIYNNITRLANCMGKDEYIKINNIEVGKTYELIFDCSDNQSYITVRRGTVGGPVVQEGASNITFTPTVSGSYFIHYNSNSSCGNSGSCCKAYIQCLDCTQYPITDQDCPGANIVCSNALLNGTSSGFGYVQELEYPHQGCLVGEFQTTWYYLNIDTGGPLEMTISPSQLSDDYDWAIWGPFTDSTAASNCAPKTEPIRCSFAGSSGTTGMGNGATDLSEDWNGNRWVAPLNTLDGQVYLVAIDNYSESNTPFNITWGGSATLSCDEIVLPVELTHFTGKRTGNVNQLDWETETETNNDYFILEHSVDGFAWNEIAKVKGAGNSTGVNNYVSSHRNFDDVINYYRLTQVDFDGKRKTFNVISIDNSEKAKLIKRINILGQEVDSNYKGIVIEYYDDNTQLKTIQK